MKLLHLDAAITGANSASRQLTAAVVEKLKHENPGLSLTYRDLAAAPLPHLTGAHLAAGQGAVPESAAIAAEIIQGTAALDEFLAADIVVIGAPMYNFSLPSQLKSWIDRIAVAGKTFRYGPNGPEGLVGGKRVIIAVSRGGLYGQQTPMAAFEHVESYLRGVFGFLGVIPHFIVAEGLAISPDQRATAIAVALENVASLKAA